MRFYILVLIFMTFSLPAMAQNFAEMQQIIALNEMKPTENPHYDSALQVRGRDITGNKNRVLGKVHDVIFNKNGEILSIYADFAAAGEPRKIHLGFKDLSIRANDTNYSMPFSEKQLALVYPEILAGTATAAGDDVDAYSLNNLVPDAGTPAAVKDENGRKIGEVKMVFFNSTGSRIETLYVELARGRLVALPLGAIMMIDKPNTYGQAQVTISNTYANAAIDYAETQEN